MKSSGRGEGYERFLREVLDSPGPLVTREGAAFRRHIGLGPAALAHVAACLFVRRGQPSDARRAIEYLRQCDTLSRTEGSYGPGVGADSHSLVPAVLAYRLLTSKPGVVDDETDRVLLAMLADSLAVLEPIYRGTEFYGATYGQLFGTALAAGVLASMRPQDSRAAHWQAYFARWHRGWQRRWSMTIDSSGYESNFLYGALLACELAGVDLASNHLACELAEDLVKRASHVGSQPASGQCYEADMPMWLPVYEYLGRSLGDGRFAHLADALWRRVEQPLRVDGLRAGTKERAFLASYLGSALQWYDGGLQPVVPRDASGLAHRSFLAPWLSQSGPEAYSPGEASERLAEKLILRGHSAHGDAYVCVNVTPRLDLGHWDDGAIVEYTRGDSVRLHDSAYFQAGPHYHNLLHVQPVGDFPQPVDDYRRSSCRLPLHRFQVRHLYDGEDVAIARIEAANYYGLVEGVRRDFLLDKRSGVLVVLDRVRAGRCAVLAGPLYHTQHVLADGADWADTRHDLVDRNFPNPPGALTVVFAKPGNAGRGHQEPEEYNGCRWDQESFVQRTVVYSSREVGPGETATIASLLIPHGPDERGEAIRRGVTGQSSDETAVFAWQRDGHAYSAAGGPAEGIVRTDAELHLARSGGGSAHVAFWSAGRLALPERCSLRVLCENPEGAKGNGAVPVSGVQAAILHGEITAEDSGVAGTLFAPIQGGKQFRTRLWCEISVPGGSRAVRAVTVDEQPVPLARAAADQAVRIPVGDRTRFTLAL
jgi:hypothetical protein